MAARLPWTLALALFLVTVVACEGEGGGGSQVPADVAPLPEDSPPIDASALRTWLEAGSYAGWPAEAAIHDSAGPHFGGVRTFLNPALSDSLAAGAAEHPRGAAAVKELFGDGQTVLGWSVMVKFQDASADGDGWYWFERYEGKDLADGAGVGACTGCHAAGADYVRTLFTRR